MLKMFKTVHRHTSGIPFLLVVLLTLIQGDWDNRLYYHSPIIADVRGTVKESVWTKCKQIHSRTNASWAFPFPCWSHHAFFLSEGGLGGADFHIHLRWAHQSVQVSWFHLCSNGSKTLLGRNYWRYSICSHTVSVCVSLDRHIIEKFSSLVTVFPIVKIFNYLIIFFHWFNDEIDFTIERV